MEQYQDLEDPLPNSNLIDDESVNIDDGSEDYSDQIHSICEERALNLIAFSPEHGFTVSEEAESLLRNVKERIGVIAVAGKYRTGKSFLLNRIILDKKDSNGFGVGPTINPCTKGLWIWSKPLEIEQQNGEAPLKVFIIDSEGIGAFNEDQNHDTRIFLLALLLSSYFVYNSMGTIDENALQNLSLIVNLSKQLQLKNTTASTQESDPDEVARYFPSFLWVVRDFALKLLDTDHNPINSKEYLENALKEQKGTSDNTEKKNRIRRLILNFFKERDCYTMVRPTEEEKDLQNLQQMDDSKLRPEFMDQMTKLRERIFKRVKPKVLNGRFITGEMLLELCHAYTTSINKGSVPCIESAWTYLCQNECQRAIQEALDLYDKEMKRLVFTNVQKSECVDYNMLKASHKQYRDEAIRYFREKAVGQNLKEFEVKIGEEIQKKYVVLKQKCLQIYENKCIQSINTEVGDIEQMIRQDAFTCIQDFNQSLDRLKKAYSEATQSIIYCNKELVLKNISEKLIIKAYEGIFRKDKETLSNQNRQLQEKINFSDSELKASKQEYEEERASLQTKFFDQQNELQSTRSSLKLYEEKYKHAEIVKQKLEIQLDEKTKSLNESKDIIEKQLQGQIRDLQLHIKQLEEANLKFQSQVDKDQALLTQKGKFVEKENSALQARIDQLQSENKALLEKAQAYGDQQKVYDLSLKEKEDERRREMENLKVFYERKLEEIRSSDSELTQEKYKHWEKERAFFQEQLTFSQKQIEENKKMHEVLLQAINSRGKDSQEQDQQMIQANKMLSETISKIEAKNQHMQQKLSQVKIFQRVFKHSQSMQCKFCTVFFPSEVFVDHVKGCNKDNRFSRSHFFQIPMSISIQQTLVKEDPQDNRTYTEYVVQINFNSKSWVVNQKYKAFCTLHELLINQYPNIKFPQSSFQFAQKSINDFGNIRGGKQATGGGSGSSSMIEDRRKILQQYLQDLALIPAIKESQQLKAFLGIVEQFPEFCENLSKPQNQLITETVSAKHAMSQNFKIFASKKQKEDSQEQEEQKFRGSHVSALNKSKLNSRNRYSNISSNPTPSKEVKDKNQYTDYFNENNSISDQQHHHHHHQDNNLDDISSIERLGADGEPNAYEYPLPEEESPSKSEAFDFLSSNHKTQSYMTMDNNKGSVMTNYREQSKDLYQMNFDQEIDKHEQIPIKKSTSSTNLMYSPASSRNPPSNAYNTIMFNDKTNHHQKKHTYMNAPSHKENCIACNQKKMNGECDNHLGIVEGGGQQQSPKSNRKTASKYQRSVTQQDIESKLRVTDSVNGIPVTSTFSILEELVKKGNNKKVSAYGQNQSVKNQKSVTEFQSKSKNPIIQQKPDSTPRDNSNLMKSDKLLQDILVKDKTPSVQGTFIKKSTPSKAQSISSHQPKSPYSNSNKSAMGNPMNQVSSSTTPDQISKKLSHNFDYSNLSQQQNTLSRSIVASHGSLASDKKVFIRSGEKNKQKGPSGGYK